MIYIKLLLEIMSAVVMLLIFFWLFIYFEITDKTERIKKIRDLPKISVVIPTLFEGKDLKLSVNSVLNSDYPQDKIKIYIGFNKATDKKTREVAYSFSDKRVKVVDTGINGKAAVMNYIIKREIKDEFIASLDADSTIDKNTFRKMINYFNNETVGAVTPSVAVHNPKKFVQSIQKYDYIFSIILRKAFSHVGNLLVAPGPGSIFRRSALEKIGYFDEKNITEDMEIAIHLLVEGYKVENCVDAFSYTIVPSNFYSLFKQRGRWYSGFFFNMIKYRRKIMNNQTNGRIDKNIMILIFASVFFSIIALPIVGYYIFYYISSVYASVSTVGINFSIQELHQILINSFYSIDTLSFIGIFLLFFGVYSLFYALKAVTKKLDALKDTVYIALYVTFFSYFLGLTWLYGFINATLLNKRIEWKIKSRN